jgi:KTSC domain
MISVNSSSICAVGYDGYNLGVQFHRSPRIYMHPGVPEGLFYELLHAPSIGAFYNRHIRGRYR